MTSASSVRPARAGTAGAALALALAVAAGYANSLDVPFLFDDPAPGVALDFSTRPVVAASFALNRAWSGFETWSYHLVNVLAHLGCALLLLGVLRRGMALAVPDLAALRRDRLALAAALLWAVHPLQTAAVTYLSQRAESLGTLAYLAHLYAFLRAESARRRRAWQALALAALLVGFGTKEIIATAPLVAWLFDASFLSRGPLRALRRRPGYHAGLAGVWLAGAWLFLAPQLFARGSSAGFHLASITPLEYARTQPGVILHYLRLVFWPHPLCFDYGWPIARTPAAWLGPTLALLVLLGTALALQLRRAWPGFVGLAFFLVLAPSSSVVPIRDAAFEHRMYLALAAPLVLLVAGAGAAARRFLPRRPAVPRLLAGAAVLLGLWATIQRNRDYRDPVRLLQETVALAPHHARAHQQLGAELLMAQRVEEGIAALHEGLRLDPNDPFGYLNLGKAYAIQGEIERALPFLERALERLDDPRAHETFAQALLLAGDAERALVHYDRALGANPGYAPTHRGRAQALAALGRNEEALRSYAQALRLDPRSAEARHLYATLLLGSGRADEALAQAESACALAPTEPEGHFVRAQALRALARPAEALAALRRVLALVPELPEPHAEFAQTVARLAAPSLDERREALAEAERANALTKGERPELLLIQAEAEAGLAEHTRALATLERAAARCAPGSGLAATIQARRSEYARRAGAPPD